MGIQFSGISSGLPVEDIIQKLLSIEHRPIDLLTQRKDRINAEKSQYAAVSTRATSLRDSLTKLTDAKLGTFFDLFKAKTATSSDATKVTASVTNDALNGSFTVEVSQLATASKASSLSTVGQWTTGASTIDQVTEGTITTGNFTVFVNGQARQVAVNTGESVQTIIDRISTEINTVVPGAGAVATVTAEGKVQLSYADGNTISFGATGDTSNFAVQTHLTTGSAVDVVGANTEFTAKYGTSTIDKQGTLTNNAARLQTAVTAGTFTVGGATFTIDATTTMEKIISDINSSSTANVTASFNTATNKLELVSKKTGNTAITLSSGTSNFLTAVGLIDGGGSSLASQTLGKNAQFKINSGTTLESETNSVDSAVSGLSGVTLTLTGNTTSPVTIDVKQDTDKIKTAVSDFVTKFNNLISFIDDQTKKGATLNGESALVRFRNEIRSEISDSADVALGLTEYTILAQVGISTGAVNASPGQSKPSATFALDESKFLAALADNPDEVKKLLVGNGVTGGVLNTLEATVKGALDPEYGVFSSREKSANDTIKNINDAIKKGEDRLVTREKQLRAQFSAMEKIISQLNQQQSSIASFANNNNR